MRIGVSAFAADAGRSGIGQYVGQLVRRLPRAAPDAEVVVFCTRSAAAALELDGSELRLVALPEWLEKPVVSILWHLLVLPILLLAWRCDVVWLPAGNRRLGLWYGVPSVGTVHDLAQVHVTDKYDRWRMAYVRRVLPSLMRRLTRVVAVSQATASDLVQHAAVDPARLTTIHNGFDHARFRGVDRDSAAAAVAGKFGVDGPYLLYVARIEHPGKNHVRLLQAFARLCADGLPHTLVLAGGRWSGAEVVEAEVARLGLSDRVVFTGFVANSDLPALYRACDVFVFPSLFEGFGIPPLEAMMSGAPVCASNAASIPEVVGEAGILFDPGSPEAIADAVRAVLDDAGLRARLVLAGAERSAGFSWEACAQRVAGVLRESIAV